MRRRLIAALAVALTAGPAGAGDTTDVSAALTAIKAVGREGAGNEAAGPAWKQLVARGTDALFPTLAAFDGASPAAANWLRSAVDAIAEAEKTAGRKLPADKLEGFVTDTTKNPAARRIAFELLAGQVPDKKNELLPKMTDDPSLEIRRDAIAAGIESIGKVERSVQAREYVSLLRKARDPDQVEKLAKLLEPLGVTPDVTAHFGFVTRFHVVGPFECKEGSALTTSHHPEQKIDLSATYTAKGITSFGWKPLATGERYGVLDLNKRLAKHKNAAAYAYAVIEVEKETPADLRAGTQNAIQIFLNGKKVFEREEYHHGTKLDQHVGKGTLKTGKNELLVKVCQNDQKEEWAQVWGFQLRVCDSLGGAVPFTVVSPTSVEAPAPPPEPKPMKKEGK